MVIGTAHAAGKSSMYPEACCQPIQSVAGRVPQEEAPAELGLGHPSNLDALCPEYPEKISSNPTSISEAALALHLSKSQEIEP